MNKHWTIAIAICASVFCSGAIAQSMAPIVALCGDPMTTGQQEPVVLPSMGWIKSEQDAEVLTNLDIAHIVGFTAGMDDLKERYSNVPVLVQSFENMMAQGQVTLWVNNGPALAINLAKTPEGGRHLACYYASGPDAQTLHHIHELDDAQDLPELKLIARRFNETVFQNESDINYKMNHTWAGITSNSVREPLTDRTSGAMTYVRPGFSET